MITLWAKTMKDHKITKQETYLAIEKYEDERFFVYLTDVCQLLDIETPVILPTHLKNFKKYRHVKFLPSDFMDAVDFDFLLIENIT